ncbi:MAG: CDP-diacylglycerol--glycerol-3-phosphate 3-phosphatidyltransferase [Deltaproteobacteria bacterium]|nr:CDP-diacylglycerol--glycerol-3-phosphate 3-phosphatidyltransferase [Deltaproteobacteria bacterium]
MWNHLPNLLTLGRIVIVVIIVIVLRDEGAAAGAVAAGFFFLACLTDYFDGQLARKYVLTTTLGKFLDPLADKLLVVGILVMLVGMRREPRIPAWLIVIVIGREIAVTGLRAIASGEGIVIPAEELGKYKMIFQMFALHGLLLHYNYLGIDFHLAGMYFLWISTVISVWSGSVYTARVAREIRAQRREGAGA